MAFRHTEETKRKLSEMRSGEKNPFFGKRHSAETKAKLATVTRRYNLTTRTYDINPRAIPDLAEWQRAYIAGLLDGEGTVHKASGRKSIAVSIANTHRPLIDWLLLTTKAGGVSKMNSPIEREPCWSWYLYGARDVAAFIMMVRPFLIIKAERADEALASLQAKYGDRLWEK